MLNDNDKEGHNNQARLMRDAKQNKRIKDEECERGEVMEHEAGG